MDNALIDNVHQSAPITAKLFENDRNRDDRSIFSVAWAKSGNGFVKGGSSARSFDLSPVLDASSDADFLVEFSGGESTLFARGDSFFVDIAGLSTVFAIFLAADLRPTRRARLELLATNLFIVVLISLLTGS